MHGYELRRSEALAFELLLITSVALYTWVMRIGRDRS